MKYVTLKPNIIWYAFGGCYPIDHQTKDFIFYKKTRGEDSWIERISRKNVLFIGDVDISKDIKITNDRLWKIHRDFDNEISNCQKQFENKYKAE